MNVVQLKTDAENAPFHIPDFQLAMKISLGSQRRLSSPSRMCGRRLPSRRSIRRTPRMARTASTLSYSRCVVYAKHSHAARHSIPNHAIPVQKVFPGTTPLSLHSPRCLLAFIDWRHAPARLRHYVISGQRTTRPHPCPADAHASEGCYPWQEPTVPIRLKFSLLTLMSSLISRQNTSRSVCLFSTVSSGFRIS